MTNLKNQSVKYYVYRRTRAGQILTARGQAARRNRMLMQKWSEKHGTTYTLALNQIEL